MTLNPGQAALFLKQSRELDLDAKFFMNWLCESPVLIEDNNGFAEGILFVYPFKENPEKNELYDKFKENNIQLHPLMLNSYDSVMIFQIS